MRRLLIFTCVFRMACLLTVLVSILFFSLFRLAPSFLTVPFENLEVNHSHVL